MKKIIAIIGILSLMALITVPAIAVGQANVTATVTVQNISVTITTNGVVSYGTLVVGGSENTIALGSTQTAENDGNITETINIRGTDSTAWFLAASASGATDYKHEFSTDAGANYTALTTTNQTLAAGVAVGGTQDFDLRITTPPSASDFNQQSVDVTIQATI